MTDYLVEGSQAIPNLVGLKFTNSDLIAYQRCRELQEGRFDILFGIDEILLAAKALGSDGAVGSTYNFAASIYHRLLSAFDRNDLASARREQNRSVHLVQTLAQNGYMASAKFFMKLRGVDVGPPRLPLAKLTKIQEKELERSYKPTFPTSSSWTVPLGRLGCLASWSLCSLHCRWLPKIKSGADQRNRASSKKALG